jgi:alkane 1-monooxygenase
MSKLKSLGFLFAYSLPVFWLIGTANGGIWQWLTPFFVFVIIPILDEVVGKDPYNIPEDMAKSYSQEQYFSFVLYAWVLVQYAVLVYAFYVLSFTGLQPLEWLGFTIGLGLITGGVGITVGHELGHKSGKLDRFLAQALYLTVCYMHFHIEHNKGHHVHVATPQDPATSRKGEAFYAFWWRSVSGGWRSAWNIEKNRLQRASLPVWSTHNAMLWYAFLPLAFVALATLGFSLWAGYIVWSIPLFFVIQSVVAFSLLEQVNYIEHYGMLRRQKPNGYYERVNPLHSWNSNHLISNLFLFHLQRHSDHHTYASKKYQVLDHYDESPQLPSGYPAMILLCLVPPLWFQVMDRRLDDWRAQAALEAAA